MTKDDKSAIYEILKTASSALKGYVPDDFSGPAPSFTDDIPVSLESGTAPASGTEGHATIESVAQKIAACHRCGLCKTRTNTVPGMGVENPAVLVIGEGPGHDEDLQGKPFVGPAGQLLDKMLSAINLDRNRNCYIANIVKCRPPQNRDPLPEEADACSSFLKAQIHILKPKMILAMGQIALQNLYDPQAKITQLHGQILDYNGIPLMATYHPSALLRNSDLKRPAWEDLKGFRIKLLELCPGY